MMMKQRMQSALQDDDRGAVAVIVAIMAVVLVGMAAFAVDMGAAYASKRDQSVTSDASSLAGAQAAGIELRTLFPAGTTCDAAVATALTPAATAAATEVYNAQRPLSSDDPVVVVECAGPEAIDVIVTSTATFDTFFGGVLGVDALSPAAAATARVTGAEAYSGLRPFAVCADSIVNDQSVTQQSLYLNSPPGNDKKPGVTCGPLPAGNWGIVDFDGGSNSNGDIADWTEFGYPGVIAISSENPVDLPGDPGVDTSAPVKSALDSIVGDIVLLPVADFWQEDSGNNASFSATGVIAVEICGYQDGKKDPVQGACWDPGLADPDVNPDPAVAEADLKIQWRLTSTVISYQSGGADVEECSLSDLSCLPAIRLYR
jgi:Flp pilus assembly protein TadG